MKPWQLVHTYGIGDFFNAESFWSDEKKAALEVIWLPDRSNRSRALIDAVEACPELAHVRFKWLSYPTEVPPGSVNVMRDHAISHHLRFRGSSFLKDKLADLPEGLPEKYAFIQPSTPANGPHCDRWIRAEEWRQVLGWLDELDLVGVVVNSSGGNANVPEDPRIVNLSGRTSMPESIEVLKWSQAYIGIDSCFAILAAQLFPADKLKVRTNNPYVYEHPYWTYPPLTDFSFLYPRFDQPAWPAASLPDRTQEAVVQLHRNIKIGNRVYLGGDARAAVEPALAVLMEITGEGSKVYPAQLHTEP